MTATRPLGMPLNLWAQQLERQVLELEDRKPATFSGRQAQLVLLGLAVLKTIRPSLSRDILSLARHMGAEPALHDFAKQCSPLDLLAQLLEAAEWQS